MEANKGHGILAVDISNVTRKLGISATVAVEVGALPRLEALGIMPSRVAKALVAALVASCKADPECALWPLSFEAECFGGAHDGGMVKLEACPADTGTPIPEGGLPALLVTLVP